MSAPTVPPTEDRSALSADDLLKLKSHLAEIREIVARLDPALRGVLTEMFQDLDKSGKAGQQAPTGRRGTFGMFAGQFSIGPEFFEPLSEEELRAWGEI